MADPSVPSHSKSTNYQADPRYGNYQHQNTRGFQPNRLFYRGRGRGRGRGIDNRNNYPSQVLQSLGVTDLREYLDRKHLFEQAGGAPPSDPSYNYLKDPMRDGDDQSFMAPTIQRSNSLKRGRGKPRYYTSGAYIENPKNIQIELSTATGQRNYSVNEDITLANIAHVPDYNLSDYQGKQYDFRGRGGRGLRSRGRLNTNVDGRTRARSTERKPEEQHINNKGNQLRSRSAEGKGEVHEFRGRGSFRSRGRGRHVEGQTRLRPKSGSNKQESGQEEVPVAGENKNRGRGKDKPRGRGGRRGRGNYNQNASNQVKSAEVATPENNDDKEAAATLPSELNQECADQGSNEEYQDYKDNSAKSPTEDSTTNEETSHVEFEENLVVTSSVNDKTKKRTVRFSLDGTETKNDNNKEQTDEKQDNTETTEKSG